MRMLIAAMTAVLFVADVSATLPPPSEEAKAAKAETAAKAAWSEKVAQYQLCLSMDRTVEGYRKSAKASAPPIPARATMPPCVNPGPYVAEAPESKPLEASGAHSPAGTAASPPSTRATHAEINGSK
jgi:hypothetical protein